MIELLKQQQMQHQHDLENHFDVISLARADRLKHYGLHFAKYAGRLARGTAEVKGREETIVDATLVSLSAANALNQSLRVKQVGRRQDDLAFTDAAGRFADACEKIDHLEDFRHIALLANEDIALWLLCAAQEEKVDLVDALVRRRAQLALRAVYVGG